MQCSQTSCEGGMRCCVNINNYPGFYCKIVSQCYQQPVWQVILIPSLLALLTLALAALIFCKLKGKKVQKRLITTYAYEQIRMKPKNRMGGFQSATTVPNLYSPDIKINGKQTEATPNIVTKSELSMN